MNNQITDPGDRTGMSEAAETGLELMLSEIEVKACEVFAQHNLPSRLGNYARSEKTQAWRFLSETLSAEERWALILAQKDGSSWRFGSLQDLGDRSDHPPALRQAAQALRFCQQLRISMAHPGGTDLGGNLEIAIRLGETWSAIKLGPVVFARSSEPLKLFRSSGTRAKSTRKNAIAKPKAG